MTDRDRSQRYYTNDKNDYQKENHRDSREQRYKRDISYHRENCTIETGTTPENTKETIHTVETGHRSVMVQIGPTVRTDTEIGYTVEIGHEATTKMTIEMSIGITVGRKIIGISKTRDMT